jgi:hypothetical protein
MEFVLEKLVPLEYRWVRYNGSSVTG